MPSCPFSFSVAVLQLSSIRSALSSSTRQMAKSAPASSVGAGAKFVCLVGTERTLPCNRREFQPDEEVSNCPLCSGRFRVPSLLRHHCRWCGRVVCDDCSGQQVKFPGKLLKQRVCSDCAAAAQMHYQRGLTGSTSVQALVSEPKATTVSPAAALPPQKIASPRAGPAPPTTRKSGQRCTCVVCAYFRASLDDIPDDMPSALPIFKLCALLCIAHAMFGQWAFWAWVLASAATRTAEVEAFSGLSGAWKEVQRLFGHRASEYDLRVANLRMTRFLVLLFVGMPVALVLTGGLTRRHLQILATVWIVAWWFFAASLWDALVPPTYFALVLFALFHPVLNNSA